MLNVVCFFWGDKYPEYYVYRLQAMLTRHLAWAHCFWCFTDRVHGLEGIPTQRLGREFAPDALHRHNYSKLRALARGFGGFKADSRLLVLDIDLVIVRDIVPLVDTDVSFKIWRSPCMSRHFVFNTSIMLMDAGCMDHIYRAFKDQPESEKALAREAGWSGTDQAIVSRHLGEDYPHYWDAKDGIYSYRDHFLGAGSTANRGETWQALPVNARIISFHGPHTPDMNIPWVKEQWR